MPFDEEADDDRPESGVPIPPEDRLWRHPSELGPDEAGFLSPPNPLAASLTPFDVPGTARPPRRRRGSWASIATVSCLAGAVIAMGVVLATRPASRVVERGGIQPTAVRPLTSVVWKQFPTEGIASEITPSVARLDIQGTKGWMQPASAVVLDNVGTLVTSAELVRGSRKIVVTFADDIHHTGRLAGVDAQTGIAVIVVNVEDRHAPDLAGTRPTIGEPAVMVGGPGPGSDVGTVTTANVRGIGRQLQADQGTLHDMIEMDRPVVDDTVGGALVDADGQVLGICLQGKLSALGFAVPIDLVRKVSDAVRNGGRVHWGRLGVKATDLNPGRAQDLGIAGAAQIVSIEPNSPAAKAGLVQGDLVTQLDMTKIESVTDLVATLSQHHPGDRLEIQFRRGDSSRSVQATLATN